jgi:hypothetical protein
MRFINLTRYFAWWTCSSVRGSNDPSKPIRIKKIHSHLINDFITLTKNNNIDLRTKSEVDIVIRVQCDKIMSCIDRKQHTTIALLFFNLNY